MKKLIRAMLLATAMSWCAPGFTAPPVASEAAYDAAYARSDLNEAGEIFDTLVKQRLPTRETGRPDPLLDRLLVRQMAANGQAFIAKPILERMLTARSAGDVEPFRLLLASVLEGTGAFDEALKLYGAVAGSAAASASDHLSALIGVARIQTTSDPAAALGTLASIDRATLPKEHAWEVDLLTSRASFMVQPDGAAGRAALDRSWAEAVDARLDDAAPAWVASDRAVAAGRAGDRAAMVAMLAVDRVNRSPNQFQKQVAANLPLCGTGGIGPDDAVMVAVAQQAAIGRPRIELVWASRPASSRAFLAAAISGSLSVPDGRVAPFMLRCRTAPSADVVVRNTLDERIAGWMTGLGAYPLVSASADDNPVALAGALAERQTRYGENSVMLLPVLLRIMASTTPDMLADADSRRRLLDNQGRLQTILEHNHAPTDIILLSRLSIIGLQVLANVRTEAQGLTDVQTLLTQAAGDPNFSPDLLYALASGTAQSPKMPSVFKTTMLSSAIDVLARRAPPGDTRTAALALRLYRLRRDAGDETGAARAIAGRGLAPNLCALADPPTHYVSSAITSDDYPGDLVRANIRGNSQVEFTLDASGAAHEGRLLLTDPVFAFDGIAAARIPTIRYDGPKLASQPAACRGEQQTILWQLPY